MSRVLVTGLGPVSSIGTGIDVFEEALRDGRNGLNQITAFDITGFPRTLGGEVEDFAPEEKLERVTEKEWGRSSLFAAYAARLAVEDAGLELSTVERTRAAAVIGTTSGESQVIEQIGHQIAQGSLDTVPSELYDALPADRLSAAVSEELGLEGESHTIATACSAGNYAIGYAYDLVSSGLADVVVTGGADSICRWAHAGFLRLGAVAERWCSPFDRDRTGMVTAEGGAVLVLEREDHALRRGARAYAEVLGYSLNCDANHMVAPDGNSITRCIQEAHRRAGITAAEIDYVCAHGTGTPANDSVEAAALRTVFGDTVPPTSSIKSMLGHSMGAASGFGAIACALAIHQGFLPPTMNWKTPDPEMPWLDPVPGVSRRASVRIAQNNGFAFGGNNAIVMLGAVA